MTLALIEACRFSIPTSQTSFISKSKVYVRPQEFIMIYMFSDGTETGIVVSVSNPHVISTRDYVWIAARDDNPLVDKVLL